MLYDLHIHSCLSPCGDDEMTPNNICGMAHLAGLEVIAVTDHNAAANLPAVKKVADAFGIMLIPGIEMCTAEDIHLLCYFETVERCLEFEKIVLDSLPPIKNRKEIYGNQLIRNEDDKIIGEYEPLLIIGSSYSLWEAVELCHQMGGVAVYAHIDKNSFSALSVLGMLPPEINIDGVEIYDLANRPKLIRQGLITAETPFMSNSDAHYLEYIGEREEHLSKDHPLWELVKKLHYQKLQAE